MIVETVSLENLKCLPLMILGNSPTLLPEKQEAHLLLSDGEANKEKGEQSGATEDFQGC